MYFSMEAILDICCDCNKFNLSVADFSSIPKIEKDRLMKESLLLKDFLNQSEIIQNQINSMTECEAFDLNKIITKKHDDVLKQNFLDYNYTLETPYTKGRVQLVLSFKLNEKTKKWLLEFKDDFELENSDFEDLSIYKNEILQFASCTHEQFNSLS